MLRMLWARRSAGDRVAMPHMVRWIALVLILVTGAVAVYTTTDTDTDVGWLPAQLRDASTLVAAREIVAALLAVLAILALRRALFARLARKPGPIQITSFDGSKGDVSSSAEDVLAEFRRTLAEMSLSTPQSVPTEPQQDSILDDVQTSLESPKNSIATIATIIRATVKIRHAYRVSAQLRTRVGALPFGITLHVVVLPGGRGEIRTIWSDDWIDVAEQAAHVVGSFILPRSRLSRRPPWTAWRGLELPDGLFHHTQIARRCKAEKRYEEAASALHRALELDPQNPYLRIELAQVQEQLGLYMDALAMYADIVAVESWYDRRLWKRLRQLLSDDTTGAPPGVAIRSRNGRDALLIARYRLVCRLIAANELSYEWARSWREEPGNDRRDAERRALRTRLTIWFESYYRQYAAVHGIRATGPGAVPFRTVSRHRQHMRHFIRFIGYCEAQHLVTDYRWTRGRRRPGMPVTQTALLLMRASVPIQLIWARSRVDVTAWWAVGIDPPPKPAWWPPTPQELDRQLDRQIRRKPRALREWQEHYNAACVFAVALAVSTRDQRKGHALRAVRHLENAVSSTDSGDVASYAQWLVTGDEDLSHLRATETFVDFLDRYLPSQMPRVARPSRLLHLVMTMHSITLLQRYARMRADFWNAQCGKDADRIAISEELDREPSARQVATTFAQNDRDWRSRLALIVEGRSFAGRRGLGTYTSSLPSFQDDPAAAEFAGRPRTDGFRSVGRPNVHRSDRFYYAKIKERNDHWPVVYGLLSGWTDGTSPGDDLPTGPESCRQYWERVDNSLTRLLYGDATVRHRWVEAAAVREPSPPVEIIVRHALGAPERAS